MTNADERKKFLEQIAELEKDSVNYFDVEKEFFLIDSNNLAEVKTRLYGYSIQATGIYEEDNLTEEAVAGLDGRGCYVYVEAKDGQITIKQDLNGSWGIYLFRHGDYFALSNSFFRLLDHVKLRYPLTVNRDYCHHLLVNSLVSHAYSETAINEVQLVERNAICHIDIAKKNLRIDLLDYKEHTLSLDTAEGIATLDRWVEFWGKVFRGLAQRTKFIQADLTGGFDSRISFVLLLSSGIDCSKIQIHSIKNSNHTYGQDYDIASQIAEHYGLKLNLSLPDRKFLNYSFADVWDMNFYAVQAVHKATNFFVARKNVEKCYYVTGYAGETIRGNWLRFGSLKNFLEHEMRCTSYYTRDLSRKLSYSVDVIRNAAFRAICNKYHVKDNDDILPQYLYQETRCRHHFGKNSLTNYFRNDISLSPALDPEVRTLRFDTQDCPDSKLLMALLFARYEPDLLTFPFDSNRFIAPETIEYAKKLNERFPRRATSNRVGNKNFHLQPKDLYTEQILSSGKNNPETPKELPNACLKSIFESRRTYGLFTSYFDAELYHYAATYYRAHVFGRERPIYGIVGITRVLEDAEISQNNRSPYRDIQRFLEEDCYRIHDAAQVAGKFKPYLTARIDVKFMATGDFQIFNVSDDKAVVVKPKWFQKDGVGYKITSIVGKLEFTAKADVDGKILLSLRGLDIRDKADRAKNIPYWIDYTKLTINDETQFDTLQPAWHNKPYSCNMDVKAGEEVTVQVEWLPHRSDT